MKKYQRNVFGSGCVASQPATQPLQVCIKKYQRKVFGSGCVAGWPAMQPLCLYEEVPEKSFWKWVRSQPTGYAATPSLYIEVPEKSVWKWLRSRLRSPRGCIAGQPATQPLQVCIKKYQRKVFGSGCVAGSPATQPLQLLLLKDRLASYAATS